MITKLFSRVVLAACLLSIVASCGGCGVGTALVVITSVTTMPPYTLDRQYSQDFIYTVTDDCVTIVGYIGFGTHAVIPVAIDGKIVTTLESMVYGFDLNDSVGGAISTFDDYHISLMASRNLGFLSIPSNVTSIGDSAFYGCDILTSITVDAGNSCYKDVDGVLFTKDGTTLVCYPACQPSSSYTIPNSVRSISEGAFIGCRILTAITIPNSVTTIGGAAFLGCNSLLGITIPNSVTSIGNQAFDGCDKLQTVALPNGLTRIGDKFFYACWRLAKIDIPNSVTSIGDDAFFACLGLTVITIPFGVKSIGNRAFSRCSNLAWVTIPGSVTSIGEEAFYGCQSLTNVAIPGSVTSIGDFAFSGCDSLSNMTVDASNNHYVIIDGVLFTKDGRALVYYPAGRKNSAYSIPVGVTHIGNWAFWGNLNIRDITIPDGTTSIGRLAFNHCSKLATLTIPGSVTSISTDAFFCCFLASITVDETNNHFEVSDGALRTKDGVVITRLRVGVD